MGKLENFVGCKVNHDPTNITLKIYQPHLTINITQGFIEDIKSPDYEARCDLPHQTTFA